MFGHLIMKYMNDWCYTHWIQKYPNRQWMPYYFWEISDIRKHNLKKKSQSKEKQMNLNVAKFQTGENYAMKIMFIKSIYQKANFFLSIITLQ